MTDLAVQLRPRESEGLSRLISYGIGEEQWCKIQRSSKELTNDSQNNEPRRAEILRITSRRGATTYYVHYEDFNKRLDELIPPSRIDLTQEVEWPAPEKPDPKSSKSGNQANKKEPLKQQDASQSQNKSLKRPRQALERSGSGTSTPGTDTGGAKAHRNVEAAGGKENTQPSTPGGDVTVASEVIDNTTAPDDEQASVVDVADAAAAAKASAPTYASREDEIEQLRTHGSMTQNQAEISRVRNLMNIQMGEHEIEPWYFSPYPASFTDADVVYICEFCLEYYASLKQFQRHRQKCTLVHPPGNEIYRDDQISFFEIDGRRQRTWCRNLCLISKLFLDHKTLYYDVDPFLFYCMCTRDSHGCHLVGYFSKEKESGEGYNLACILTLPQYQRKGYGRLLIAFSYELSKREAKVGSPEKPLSDLGLLGYRAYWAEVILDLLLDGRTEATVEELGAATAMTTNDVLHTLQNLNMLRFARNGHVIILSEVIVEQRKRQREKEEKRGKHFIQPEKLIWKPPVFTASARTWNW